MVLEVEVEVVGALVVAVYKVREVWSERVGKAGETTRRKEGIDPGREMAVRRGRLE